MVKYKDVFYKGKFPSRICLFCVPNEGMTIVETENYRLIADTFPIVPGHLMISSKAHYSSAGEIADYLRKELLEIKAIAKELAIAMSGGCIFYEHGKAGSCHAHSADDVHCEHFHLHCLPVSICIHSKLANHFSGINMKNYADIFYYYSSYGSYLYFENFDGKMVYYPAEKGNVPPHYLRTLICEELQVGDLSNWQTYEDLDRYLISREKIANSLRTEPSYAVL